MQSRLEKAQQFSAIVEAGGRVEFSEDFGPWIVWHRDLSFHPGEPTVRRPDGIKRLHWREAQQ